MLQLDATREKARKDRKTKKESEEKKTGENARRKKKPHKTSSSRTVSGSSSSRASATSQPDAASALGDVMGSDTTKKIRGLANQENARLKTESVTKEATVGKKKDDKKDGNGRSLTPCIQYSVPGGTQRARQGFIDIDHDSCPLLDDACFLVTRRARRRRRC